LRLVDGVYVSEAVALGVHEDRRQPRRLRLAPGHQQTAGLQQRQVEIAVDLHVLGIAGAHACELQRIRHTVIAGMPHGAVALARAGQDVGASFQECSPYAAEAQATEDGATNHTSPDDGDVVGHGRSIAACSVTVERSEMTRRKEGALPYGSAPQSQWLQRV